MSNTNLTEEGPLCPICCEVLDATDLNFYPCQCNYQICLWCYKRISEGAHPLCPACRTPYDKSKVHEQPSKKVVEQAREEQRQKRMQKEREAREKTEKRPPTTVSGPPPALAEQLANVKVRQRNLVYVAGIPLQDCREESLRRNNWFGRFGRIVSCICKNDTAYITYNKSTEAETAIQSMHGRPTSDGRSLRCAVGTTKYCSFFLRRQECPNPHCLYLHELARSEDSYYEEYMEDTNFPETPDSPLRQGYAMPAKTTIVRNSSAPLQGAHHVRHVNPPQNPGFGGGPHHPAIHSHNSVPQIPQPPIGRPRGVEPPIGTMRATNMQRTASMPTPPPVQRFGSNEVPAKPPRLRAPPGFSSSHQVHDNHMSSPRDQTAVNRTPTAIGHAWHGSTISRRNNGSRTETTPIASSSPSSQWPPMPTVGVGLSRDDPILKSNVVRGVVYADELPHEKKRRQAASTISNSSFDFNAILQSLLSEDVAKLPPFANMAAVSYTTEAIVKALGTPHASRFSFVSTLDTKEMYNSDSVIQKLLNSSSSSLYDVFK